MQSTSYENRHQSNRRDTSWRRWVGLLLIIIFLAILVVGARAGLLARDVYSNGLDLINIAQNQPTAAELPLLQAKTAAVAQSLGRLESTVRPFGGVLRLMKGVPTYGPTLASTPELLEIGSGFADMGHQILTLAAPHLGDTSDLLSIKSAVAVMEGSGPELSALAPLAMELEKKLAALPVEQLHPMLADRLPQIQSLGPLMPAGLLMAPALPELLGYDAPRSYLILVQNNHELRATGGFLTAVGTFTLTQGDIADLDFVDSYKLASDDGQYPAAPEPMQRYMNIPLILLRDANWSPDLPTSAQLARSLYEQETGVITDGIVTIDLDAVEIIVDALAPLAVAGTDEPVTGANVVDLVKQFWDQPTDLASSEKDVNWWRQRKDFMPTLAAAALIQLENDNVDLSALLQAGLQALNRRSIQIWLSNPDAEPVLAKLGWDGGLNPPVAGDFLALVDTNMGYNKVNAVVERTISYQVAWSDDPQVAPRAITTIVYTHPLQVPEHACDLTPRYGLTYDDMTKRCYFNYVRLYTPSGSRLVSTDGFDEAADTGQRGEGGTQVFSGYFVLHPGKERTITLTYDLPAAITQSEYSLLIRRQSGTSPIRVNLVAGQSQLQTVIEAGELRWSP